MNKNLGNEKDRRWRTKGGVHRAKRLEEIICPNCNGIGINCETCNGEGHVFKKSWV